MSESPSDLSNYPLSKYFFSGYLSRKSDPINFPFDCVPDVLQKYENLFAESLKILDISKEKLQAMQEFNFDSGDPANLEAGIAVLRVVCTLANLQFSNIAIIRPRKGESAADITCERKGHKICCETKAITKLSRPREECGYEDEVEKKVRESIGKARSQLNSTAGKLGCSVKLFACVMNWQIHPVLLRKSNYCQITKRLERDEELSGIDGVLFINTIGEEFMFLTERGKCIDD